MSTETETELVDFATAHAIVATDDDLDGWTREQIAVTYPEL